MLCIISKTIGQDTISLSVPMGLWVKHTVASRMVTVVLGSIQPVVLRPSSTGNSNKTTTWKIVSVANVTDLMRGEAIYGDKLPSHWRAVTHDLDYEAIDNGALALYDPETSALLTNPAKLLTDAGIKVEEYQKDPHVLKVLLETLRATGIPLQEFLIV